MATVAHEAATDWEETVKRARTNLLDFTRFTKADYRVNWHHRILARELDRVVSGEVTRLMVFMPPQTGKTELVSRRMPALVLGQNPDERVIACSYAADLTKATNRDVQRIVDDDDYRILFPESQLTGEAVRTSSFRPYVRTSDHFEIVGHTGSYRSAGRGGPIAGYSASVALIDDILKDQNEANSPTVRESCWIWYTGDFIKRLDKNGRIVIVMTRRHRDDLAGRLLRMEPDQWRVILLPSLRGETKSHEEDPRAEGEALWPDHKTREVLERERELGRTTFAAVDQQDPSEGEGAEWPESYFGPHIWCPLDKWPANADFKLRVITVDPSKGKSDKHGDYSAIIFLGVHTNGLLYVDCSMDRRPVNKIVRDTLEFCRVYSPHMVGIESNQFQELMLGEFNRATRGLFGTLGFRAFGVNNMLNKIFRIRRLSPYVVDRELRFKADSPGCRLLVDQLLDFPNAAHDDGPDALEMACRLPMEVGELQQV